MALTLAWLAAGPTSVAQDAATRDVAAQDTPTRDAADGHPTPGSIQPAPGDAATGAARDDPTEPAAAPGPDAVPDSRLGWAKSCDSVRWGEHPTIRLSILLESDRCGELTRAHSPSWAEAARGRSTWDLASSHASSHVAGPDRGRPWPPLFPGASPRFDDAVDPHGGTQLLGPPVPWFRGQAGPLVPTFLDGIAVPEDDGTFPAIDVSLLPAGPLAWRGEPQRYRADLPATLGTGAVELVPVTGPPTLAARVELGASTGTTFQDLPSGPPAGAQWLGFGAGPRGLPDALAGGVLARPGDPGYLPAAGALRDDWRDFDETTTALPDLKLGLAAAMSPYAWRGPLHVAFAAGYERATLRREPDPEQTVGPGGPATPGRTVEARTVGRWASALNLVWQLDTANELRSLTTFAHDGTDVVTDRRFLVAADDEERVSSERRWIERTMVLTQLAGRHRVLEHHGVGPGRLLVNGVRNPEAFRLDWQANVSWGVNDQPDQRAVTYAANPGQPPRFGVGAPATRRFDRLARLDVGGGVDAAVAATDWLTARAGVRARFADVDADRRLYAVRAVSPTDPRNELPPSQLFAAENLGETFDVVEVPGYRTGAAWDATETTVGAFAMVEAEPVPWLYARAGVRLETFRRDGEIGDEGAGAPTRDVDYTTTDPFPSAFVEGRFRNGMALSAGYQTSTLRPSLAQREVGEVLAPPGSGAPRDTLLLGNDRLDRTYVHDVDVTWHLLRDAAGQGTPDVWIGERVSVSAFATVYDDLALMREPVPGRAQFVQTSGRAWRVGAEANADVDLARFGVPCLRPHGNVTLVRSVVETLDDTRLPGQAEWTATAGVSWTPDRLPFEVHLWYGAIGPRTVGPVPGVPERAITVEPFHRLDAAIDVSLGAGFLLRAFAENLAFRDQVLTRNGAEIQRVPVGARFGLRLSWGPERT